MFGPCGKLVPRGQAATSGVDQSQNLDRIIAAMKFYNPNSLTLLGKNMLCVEFHCQRGFNLIFSSYEIVVDQRRPRHDNPLEPLWRMEEFSALCQHTQLLLNLQGSRDPSCTCKALGDSRVKVDSCQSRPAFPPAKGSGRADSIRKKHHIRTYLAMKFTTQHVLYQ